MSINCLKKFILKLLKVFKLILVIQVFLSNLFDNSLSYHVFILHYTLQKLIVFKKKVIMWNMLVIFTINLNM